MTTTTIDPEHTGKFPIEIAKAVDGLSGEKNRAVFIVLFNEGELAFSQLQEELGAGDRLHQEKLTTALNELKEGGLIRKQIREDDESSPFSSYYSVSEYGNRFLDSLFTSLGEVDSSQVGRLSSERVLEDDLLNSAQAVKQEIQGVV